MSLKNDELTELSYTEQCNALKTIYSELNLVTSYKRKMVFYLHLEKLLLGLPDLAEKLIDNFEETIKFIEFLAKRISEDMIEYTIRVIPYNSFPFSCKNKLQHSKKMYRLKGQIYSLSSINAIPESIKFECKKCGQTTWVLQNDKYKIPSICKCGNIKQWKEIEKQYQFYQTFQFVESKENILPDEIPQNIICKIKLSGAIDDYISNRLLGKTVEVVGSSEITSDYQIIFNVNNVIEVNEVKITEQDEQAIKLFMQKPNAIELIARFITKNTYKYHLVKKTILLTCIGLKSDNDKALFHTLIVGDFGVAKTQMAMSFIPYIPRMRILSGTGLTYVGLCGGVEKNPLTQTWELRMGALQMSHNSVLVCDEMDKMPEDSMNGLHTEMSDGIVTIDKAGIHADFLVHTNIIALANPVNMIFSPETKLFSQIDIPHTLLDRFGIIIFLRKTDFKSKEDKQKIMRYMAGKEQDNVELTDDFCKKIILWLKNLPNPKIPDDIYEEIEIAINKVQEKYGEELTYRQINNIIKFVRIHARASARTECNIEDVKAIFEIYENLMWTPMYSTMGTVLDMVFQEKIEISQKTKYPKSEKEKYDKVMDIIYHRVEIEHDLLLKEVNEFGINEKEFNKIIELAKKKGDIYEPRYDVYKSML